MAIHILVPLKYMTTNLFIHLMDLIFPHYEHLKKLNSIPRFFFFFLMQLYPAFISLIFVVFFFSKLYIRGEPEWCEWPISTSKSGTIRGDASYGRSCSPRNDLKFDLFEGSRSSRVFRELYHIEFFKSSPFI
jgi:hypothetical protein